MSSRGVNKVILVGNVGQDPEVRSTQGGDTVTTMSVATSESWKDKATGQQQDRTEWHRVVFFKKLAEIAGQYVRKGSKVYVEGSLRTRKWQDKQGVERYTTEIMGSDLQMLDSRPESSHAQPSGQQYSQPAPRPKIPQQTPAFDDFEDDIPF